MTVNPVAQFRSDNHLTQKDLANELNITRQVITNLESGLLSSLPDELASYINQPGIQDDYLSWVQAQRTLNSRYFHTREVNNVLQEINIRNQYEGTNWKPKEKWFMFKYAVRPDTSHRGFCRLLVYQPSMLTLFETKNQCKPSLAQALRQVSLSENIISLIGVKLDSVISS